MSAILTLNAGSSSMKFGLYRAAAEPEQMLHGQIDGIGGKGHLVLETSARKHASVVSAASQHDALQAALQALAPHLGDMQIVGVGHRIVHGGPDFAEPVVLSPDVLNALTAFSSLAPLHQPHNLGGVAVAQAAFPDAVQIGCFDTAFHRGHPWVNDTFALPRRYYDAGVRRYGFHGLSYDYITGVIAERFPALQTGRIIVAHLGNGASMCAIHRGKSVGSTMGFSALDGLPMGTRCGQIDPGAVLYLMEHDGLSYAEVLQILYKESGLLGLSTLSSDMRTLLASDRPEAAEAIDYYVFRARREIGALTAVLGGLDALVFCGGIGENAAPIRARICEGLDYLGVRIAEDRNARNETEIGGGRTQVLVVPTDEERVIARAVAKAIG